MVGLHDEREPPSDVADYILWHGHQAPPHTHTQKRDQKEHGREPDSNEIGLCPLGRDGSARPSPFFFGDYDWTVQHQGFFFSISIYILTYPGSVYRLSCRVVGGLYTECLSSFFSEREIYIFTESCRLLTDRRTNPEHKPD